MHFTRMKITGFKSFVEPTDFMIEPGLTGIVGPNGCGKSNVVESLRWVMGENSAKRLRGGEMDDVIFSGSAGRPARNISEVTLYLDNRERTAMAEFNNDDAIEVTRRIERSMGSDYRINGKPVRQKDVQLLFADQATGAHSTSIVSQGRISALIQAKPQERRQVLEEAAGISGLHARRHEAELKLKGAEGNLTRVGDQLQAMDAQLRSLKTQVRQASRYRNLGELIRKAEGALLYLRTREAEINLRLAEDNLSESEIRVRDLTRAVTLATTARTERAATLPPLRQAETAASAVVQRLFLEREALERDVARIAQERANLQQRLADTAADETREAALLQDAQAAIARLEAEKAELQAKAESLNGAQPQLQAAVSAAEAEVWAQEKAVAEQTESFAEAHAQHNSVAAQIQALTLRSEQLSRKHQDVLAQKAAMDAALAQLPSLALAASLIDACETDLQKKQQVSESTHAARETAEAALNLARATRERAWSEKTRLEAETAALQKLLQLEDAAGSAPLSDLVKVEPGYEAAFAAALGDALSAPLDPAAKIFWQNLPAYDAQDATLALPQQVQALTAYVEAPPALIRALQQIGLVENEAQGEALMAKLRPGQVLVTRAGDAWRWDGYTQRASAVTPAAMRLQQRNRLAELEALNGFAEMQARVAEQALQQAASQAQQTVQENQQAQVGLQRAFTALNEARRHYASQAEMQAQQAAQAGRLADMAQQVEADVAQARQDAAQLQTQRDALPHLEHLAALLGQTKNSAAEKRQALSQCQAEFANYQRDMQALRARLGAAETEHQSWQTRTEVAQQRLVALHARHSQLQQEEEALAQKPQQMEAQRAALLDQSSAAEITRAAAADLLQEAENALAQLEKETRAKEEALTSAKENRVRTEEQMYQAQHAHTQLVEKLRADWHCQAGELLEKIGIQGPEQLQPVDQLEQEFTRYTRERENMGPVNLRAEMEAEALQQQIDTMVAEKDDLVSAIAKLRQGIGTLNREARERLQQAFDAVNGHFGSLFTRLFGGGKAHLQLMDSEDPLEAGLEIFASPPGKRLQALSLLSGGEQALTALSLLFSLFMVNPSPICVLDEVDAPLDEANVDRYCMLLREMAESTKTRFLIITHHRLTMARMDRLYGVTMAEKGVSQLVSVDLKQALAMREQGGQVAAASSPNSYEAAAE